MECILVAQVSQYKVEVCLAGGGKIHDLSEVELGCYFADV